jgi:uncharacterized protein YutE (UPF0331/DUF86 family)
MVFTAAKRWELVGITSYGFGCAKTHSGAYTRITAFLTFIHTTLNDTSPRLSTITCACECPRGFNQDIAYTTEYSAEACVKACIAVSPHLCTSSNTYAYLETNYVYSDSYEHSTTTSSPQYTCSCECPRGFNQGIAYTTEYSAEACIEACIDVSSNICTSSDTYACLGTNCIYSNSYTYSTTTSIPQYTCTCECPRGFNQGSAYTTEYSAETCIEACIDVSSNLCTSSDTYACLETNCVYSDSYEHSTTTSSPQYTCSCECPRGFNQDIAYTTEYSAEACVKACIGVSSNLCTSSNIYACLGTNCVYSDSYTYSTTTSIPQYTCTCECPRGVNQGSAYTTEYSAEACVEACIGVSLNLCTSPDTYACLGTNCVYSDSYKYPTTTSIPQYTCSCECPLGFNQRSAYTTEYSAEACVKACIGVSPNSCTSSNTYACLGTYCVYSNSYNYPTMTLIPQYTCSCECPRGFNQGIAYTTEYSAEACAEACIDVSSNLCTSSDTYACLGTNCVYSIDYSLHNNRASFKVFTWPNGDRYEMSCS